MRSYPGRIHTGSHSGKIKGSRGKDGGGGGTSIAVRNVQFRFTSKSKETQRLGLKRESNPEFDPVKRQNMERREP